MRSESEVKAHIAMKAAAIGLLTTVVAWAVPARAQMACQPCVVGVVLDSPWERSAETLAEFESAVIELTAPRFEVVFPAAQRRAGDSTLAGVGAAVDASLADPDVDLVLAAGSVATTWAARRDWLPKPVVGVLVLDPELQGVPVVVSPDGERVSGKPNLSYVTFANDLANDVRRFREVVPFAGITFVGERLPDSAGEFEARLQAAVAQVDQDIRTEFVRVGTSAADALAAIPPAAEAVYVTPLRQLPPEELERLIRGLNERRLPTFSAMGRREVEAGLLMSLYDDADSRRLGRRLAVHVQRLLRGEDPGALPIDFRRGRRLTINMATARAIGWYPDWRVRTEADLVGAAPVAGVRRLSLTRAAHEAVAANLDLAAEDLRVAAGRQIVRESRAALRPRVSATGVAERIDPDRAGASLGLVPAWLGGASVGVSQILYSDAARADVEIDEQRQKSRRQDRAQRRLDIVHAAAVAYLDVLRTISVERIQRENLTLTRSNLDLAEARRRIGVARASEVIRWQTEVATNRRAVIDAGARRHVAAIALNRLLHRPLEEPFETVDVDMAEPRLLGSAMFQTYAANPFGFALFRDFLVQEGLANAPELRRRDAEIAARTRSLLAARRALRLPTVVARGELATLAQPAPGAVDVGGLHVALPPRSRLDWTVRVEASLPLFEGGARRAARARADRELEELLLQRRASAERIEQRIRSTLLFAGASFVGIELATDASVAARRNLELLVDAYEQGGASILDLLDAQQAAVAAEQVAANAVYDHLIDLLDVQRAFGRFGFLADAAYVRAFGERLRAFFAAAGYAPRGLP